MKSLSDLSFVEIVSKFSEEKAARNFLESLRWPHGPACPHCQNNDQEKIWKIEENKEKKIRPGLYQCGACKKQFTVTVGTIFEDSHIPLGKWLIAWHMICCSKKGISALQMQRMLGLGSYRTAHFMMHRIRHALLDPAFDKKLGGTVEVDETYIGGEPRTYALQDGRQSRGQKKEKMPVVSMVERDGEKRSFSMRVTSENLRGAIEKHVAPFSAVCTDESNKYVLLRTNKKIFHHRVNHSKKQYALKVSDKFTAHSNTVESSFSLLKRGIIGTFHQISPKYLPLYLAEFDFRWNTKKKTDGQRTIEGLGKIAGKRLIYGSKRENAAKAATPKASRKYVLRRDNWTFSKGKTAEENGANPEA